MTQRVVAAIDIGVSEGQVVAGIINDGRVALDSVHSFPNGAAQADGHLRWNVTELFQQVLHGLSQLASKYPDVESIGIDTWGLDYGLLGRDGRLLAEPISSRDGRTDEAAVRKVHDRLPHAELFQINGLQFLPATTLYQLFVEGRSPLWKDTFHVALIPDLLAYWLTGVLRSEYTNATATGLVDVTTGRWSMLLIDRLVLRHSMLPAVEQPGATRGPLLPAIAKRIDLPATTVVTTVGSLAAASAVVAVPATGPNFAYIVADTSSSVAGVELKAPVLTDAAFAADFTNEGGVDGRFRFQRIVDDPNAIASAIQAASELSGQAVEVVHIVGAGSANVELCQQVATATGLRVIAGPVEAGALGNVLVQGRAIGAAGEALQDLRTMLAASTTLTSYEP